MKTKLLLLTILLCTNYFVSHAQLNVVYSSSTSLRDIFCLNSDTVFVCANNGILLSTNNGGIIWKRDSLPTKFNLNSIIISKKGIGYIAGDSGTIFRSKDFGKNWDKISTNINDNLSNIQFYNDSCGFALNKYGSFGNIIYKTTNKAKTWNIFYTNDYIDSFNSFGNDTIYVGTVDGLYYTYNDGVKWDLTNITGGRVFGMAWTSNTIGYISNDYALFETIDAGKSVTPYLSVKIPRVISVINDSIIYAGGYEPLSGVHALSKKTKGLPKQENLCLGPNAICFLNKDTGYVLNWLVILKTINGRIDTNDNCTSSFKVKSIKTKDFVIMPNPMIDMATIKIESNKNLHFQLFNSLGKLIEDENLNTPSYQIYKGKKSAGIYIYKIIKQGTVVSTGKLIIQ